MYPDRETYASRNADVMGRREAFTAGSMPPMTPITTAKMSPIPSAAGAMRNAKATSAKFAPPAAELMPLVGRASRQPMRPPTNARNVDSRTKEVRMLMRAQRADLARPRRNDAVHRVHRTEHGADAHDDGDEAGQADERRRNGAGLVV